MEVGQSFLHVLDMVANARATGEAVHLWLEPRKNLSEGFLSATGCVVLYLGSFRC